MVGDSQLYTFSVQSTVRGCALKINDFDDRDDIVDFIPPANHFTYCQKHGTLDSVELMRLQLLNCIACVLFSGRESQRAFIIVLNGDKVGGRR